jgi:hypothetical protein
MTSTSKNARIAEFLYLLLVIAGPLRLMYIPSTLFVHGNASAAANNIGAHETLFRLGIVGDLFCGTIAISLDTCGRHFATPLRYAVGGAAFTAVTALRSNPPGFGPTSEWPSGSYSAAPIRVKVLSTIFH